MSISEIRHIKTISELHRFCNLEKPKHPLISVVDYSKVNLPKDAGSIICDYYSIAIKKGVDFDFIYGQQQYDFEEGVMIFTAPKQVIRLENKGENYSKREGWILYIHPDFIWNTALAKSIKKYDFFNYSVNEALFLSEAEQEALNTIIEGIKKEYDTNIDKFSQSIIISQIETLLNYSERFYQRQFITRKKANHQILENLENLLNNYFYGEKAVSNGLPTVQFISDQLNISQSYLSSLLKSLTGQSTQQIIHEKIIQTAKEKLSTSSLSVSEIAYELGFEHPQSFSKFFKSKTLISPIEFRQSFN